MKFGLFPHEAGKQRRHVNHLWRRDLFKAFPLAMLTLFSLCLGPARAEMAAPDQEKIMKKQFQWIFYCDMDVLPQFMNYKGSPTHPIVRFVVTFVRTNAFMGRNTPAATPIKYEELWYHDGQALGMKRYGDIFPGPMEQGAIYVRAMHGNDSVCMYTRDVADAIVRLTMDTYMKRSIMAGVFVPIDCFDQIASDLGFFNFFLMEVATGGIGENMTLHMQSYPKGKDKYFYYNDTGR
jgi:hypothetical protein